MVDTTIFAESKWINADLIEKSESKIVIPTSAGEIVSGMYGPKFEIEVELDAKAKVWTINQSQMKDLHTHLGTDSKNWLNKKIQLAVADGKVIVMCEVK